MGGVRAAASEVRDGRRRSCGEWRRTGAAQAAPATGRTQMEEFDGRRRFVAAAANG